MHEKIQDAVKDLNAPTGASVVLLGTDNILKIAIDLSCLPDKVVETRIAAYGTIAWAHDIIQRHFMFQEMQQAKKEAMEAAEKKKIDIQVVPAGVVDVRGMRLP